MKPRQLDVAFAFFPYGGNGSTSSEVPTVRDWTLQTVVGIKDDCRINRLLTKNFSDTPITMTRNAAVEWARSEGMDVLLMLDSDMAPDCELGTDPLAKPFWETSFRFLYEHYDRGPVVVGAPYCGPPPHENVYVFRWENKESGHPNPDWKLGNYTRPEAEMLAGIQEVDALPTGLILYDLRVFDHLPLPWFEYEWEHEGAMCPQCQRRKPGPRSKKVSTEDISNTRNIALHAHRTLGYNPLFCNWDAWAGHWKPKLVRKPRRLKLDSIEPAYREAACEAHRAGERLHKLTAVDPGELPDPGQLLASHAPKRERIDLFAPAMQLAET